MKHCILVHEIEILNGTSMADLAMEFLDRGLVKTINDDRRFGRLHTFVNHMLDFSPLINLMLVLVCIH